LYFTTECRNVFKVIQENFVLGVKIRIALLFTRMVVCKRKGFFLFKIYQHTPCGQNEQPPDITADGTGYNLTDVEHKYNYVQAMLLLPFCKVPSIANDESYRGHGYLSVVSVVCCQVEVSATS
jgi:hypothetical protein